MLEISEEGKLLKIYLLILYLNLQKPVEEKIRMRITEGYPGRPRDVVHILR